MQKFDTVVCGGTFDHFHKGHEEFLRFALACGRKIIIGLTSEKYVKENKKDKGCLLIEKIESYRERKETLEFFLKKEKAENRATIVLIDDFFGPTLEKDLSINAIVVSDNSLEGAELINLERKKINLPSLKVIIQPLIKGEDGKIISSTRIRAGEINREGRPYLNPDWLRKKLFLTEKLRQELKSPSGELLQNDVTFKELKNTCFVTVGDIATRWFNERKFYPKIAVVDFRVAKKQRFSDFRQLYFPGKEKIIRLNKPAGCLTPSLFKACQKAFDSISNKQNIIIKINGEEDLAVLPILIASPLGFYIFYGQPNMGVIKISVTESNKQKAYQLISRFQN